MDGLVADDLLDVENESADPLGAAKPSGPSVITLLVLALVGAGVGGWLGGPVVTPMLAEMAASSGDEEGGDDGYGGGYGGGGEAEEGPLAVAAARAVGAAPGSRFPEAAGLVDPDHAVPVPGGEALEMHRPGPGS